MVRQREFDIDEVLAIAMNLFWQRGYTSTSMKDLVQATGIQPRSLGVAEVLKSVFGSPEWKSCKAQLSHQKFISQL